MRFQPGQISLGNIAGGTLASGVVPFPRFQTDYQEQENAGAVNVTSGNTTVNLITLTGAVIGDRILVIARLKMQKGGTTGHSSHNIARSAGPGTVDFMKAGVIVTNWNSEHILSKEWGDSFALFGEVTGAGDITLRQAAQSFNSDSTCAIGGAAIAAWLIPGS